MRQLGAWLLGVWYSLVISSALMAGIRGLSENPNAEHYFLESLAWLLGVGFGSWLAAGATRKTPVGMAVLSAIGVLSLLALLLYTTAGLEHIGDLSQAKLPPLMFGWQPGIAGFAVGLAVSSLVLALVAGSLVKESAVNSLKGILGFRAMHWTWLWIPFSFWATQFPLSAYLIWLDLVLGWHMAVHISLWFDWRWILYGIFGAGFTFVPLSCLFYGIGFALESISIPDPAAVPQKKRALRFLLWGVGLGVVGSSVFAAFAAWLLSHLPIIAPGKLPWWVA